MIYRADLWKKLINVKKILVDKCDRCCNGYIETKKGISKCNCMIVYSYISKLIIAEIPQEYWTLRYRDLNIPKDYIELIDFYITRLDNAIEKSKGLFLSGVNGVGKTSMLCEIAKYFIIRGYTVKYFTAERYIYAVQSNDVALQKDYESADVQIIDELGKNYMKKGSDFVVTKLEEYLRKTLTHKVVLTASNFNDEELTDLLGDSTMSILRGHLKFVPFNISKDYRKVSQDDWVKELDSSFNYYHKNIVSMAIKLNNLGIKAIL